MLSVLILSSLLFTSTLAVSMSVFVVKKIVSQEESYREARVAAYTCTSLVLYSLWVDTNRFIATPVTFPITASSSCEVVGVLLSPNSAVITLEGKAGESVVPFKITAERTSTNKEFTVTRWEEN